MLEKRRPAIGPHGEKVDVRIEENRQKGLPIDVYEPAPPFADQISKASLDLFVHEALLESFGDSLGVGGDLQPSSSFSEQSLIQ